MHVVDQDSTVDMMLLIKLVYGWQLGNTVSWVRAMLMDGKFVNLLVGL